MPSLTDCFFRVGKTVFKSERDICIMTSVDFKRQTKACFPKRASNHVTDHFHWVEEKVPVCLKTNVAILSVTNGKLTTNGYL